MPIVVGVDGSAESKEALRWAVEEGRLRVTGVRALVAWEYPPLSAGTDPYLPGAGDALALIDPGDLASMAGARLAEAVAESGATSGEVEEVVVEGHPAKALLEAAKDAELLVVGSRGHGGFTGALLGSVSQACVSHAPCTVVVVRT
jgi:nucleotide-binding universal stress UspA family protein